MKNVLIVAFAVAALVAVFALGYVVNTSTDVIEGRDSGALAALSDEVKALKRSIDDLAAEDRILKNQDAFLRNDIDKLRASMSGRAVGAAPDSGVSVPGGEMQNRAESGGPLTDEEIGEVRRMLDEGRSKPKFNVIKSAPMIFEGGSIAAMRLRSYSDGLDLSEDQKEDMKKIIEDFDKRRREIFKGLTTEDNGERLSLSIGGKDFSEKMKRLREEEDEEVARILSSEQFEKYKKKRSGSAFFGAVRAFPSAGDGDEGADELDE